MTKQQIYNTLVSLTAEIKATGVGLKLFEAAKESGQSVKAVAETFMAEYSKLYQEMCSFASEFNQLIEEGKTGNDGVIFGPEESEEDELWVLDPNVIDAPSFFALTFLTDIDDWYLFNGEYIGENDDDYVSDDSAYLDALEEESGSCDFADYLGTAHFTTEELECLEDHGFNYTNFYDLLADIFAGELKEYVG